MSITFVRFGWRILLFITPSAIVLSVWIGVRGCGWPILVSICRRYLPSFAFKNSAPSSASATDDMTTFMMVTFVMMAPLLGGVLVVVREGKMASRSASGVLLVVIARVAVDA